MSEWVPVSAALRAAFFKPVDLSTAAPSTVIGNDHIKAKGFRLHKIKLQAKSSYAQWLSLRHMAAADAAAGPAGCVYLEPITPDLNANHVAFMHYLTAGRFCALTKQDFAHITGPAIVQGNACFLLPGAIARDFQGILAPGILPLTSWPGCTMKVARPLMPSAASEGQLLARGGEDKAGPHRGEPGHDEAVLGVRDLATFVVQPGQDGGDSEEEDEADTAEEEEADTAEEEEVPKMTTIAVREELPQKERWPIANFALDGLDARDRDNKWNVAHARWSQVQGHDHGLVTFFFPVLVMQDSQTDLSRMHRIFQSL